MSKSDELRIRGISPNLKSNLKSISKNVGISMAALIKPKLHEIVTTYPEHMRRERKD